MSRIPGSIETAIVHSKTNRQQKKAPFSISTQARLFERGPLPSACFWSICTSRTSLRSAQRSSQTPLLLFGRHTASSIAFATLCRASGLGSLVLKLGVEHVAAADGGDVVACRRSLLVCCVRRLSVFQMWRVGSFGKIPSRMKEICRVAERRLSLRTVPPEVASSGAETCEMHISYLKSIHSRIAMSNGSSFRSPSWVPDSLAIRKGGDVPKATERSRTRPRLSMPVMGLIVVAGILEVFAGVVAWVWIADWYSA